MVAWKEKRISGRKVSRIIKRNLAEQVALLKEKGISPGLAVILVGDDPASAIYVRLKEKGCADVGITSKTYHLESNIDESDLIKEIHRLNEDDSVHGILVQMPLPSGISESKVMLAVSPEKDVDGLHPFNMGRLLRGEKCFQPCTPAGILQLLHHYSVKTKGAHVVIVGRSNIVGKSLAAMLIQKKDGANASVTVVHSATRNLPSITKQADILVAAVGRPEFITGDMIKEGAVVIDVGVNRVERNGTDILVGDCEFESCGERASLITPVPGGVGPMTIAMLLSNTVLAASAVSKKEVK
jgi:methylenetetrahydrofolate dehydrogenase (NADP+)/methenyltetrahydrofolate cyclohydrolase